MKPLKQVVYLPTSKETITAVCNFDNHWSHHEYVEYKEGYFFTPEQLDEYSANVIKQALEVAADKLKLNKKVMLLLMHK